MISRNGEHNCRSMSFSILSLVKRGSLLRDVLPFDAKRACLTYMGRNAVWQAVRILGLKPGDEVLVPAYNCGSEIDPLLHHGLTIVPYRVSRSTQIDIKDILSRVNRRTRAVYVTHYFGFPQRLEEIVHFCRERGLFLVEDCALALFSQDNDGFVGRLGDVAVFSFRKTLPVPDGGAVVINNPNFKIVSPLEQPTIAPVLAALVTSLGRSAERWSHIEFDGVKRSYRWIQSGINRLHKRKRHFTAQGKSVMVRGVGRASLGIHDHYDPGISWLGMSAISKRILGNVDPREVAVKRRQNFQYLLPTIEEVRGIEPLFRRLPNGVCPTAFPVLCENRSELCRKLNERWISAIEWWSGYHPSIRWDEFPEGVYLKDHLIALPVHHGLNVEDMAYIGACVREIMSEAH